MIVCKFGGSCITANNLPKVKKIIEANSNRRFIVVSAIGKYYFDEVKVTDLLIEYAKTNSVNILNKIISRHKEIVNKLKIDIDIEKIIIEQLLTVPKFFIDIGLNKNEFFDIEYYASRGEYFAGIIVAKYLNFEFVDTTFLVQFNVKLLEKKTVFNLKTALENKKNAVITGFYGSRLLDKKFIFDSNLKEKIEKIICLNNIVKNTSSTLSKTQEKLTKNSQAIKNFANLILSNRKIATFSRGGSDITGSLVAVSVNADVYENYSDVNGYLTTNPKFVTNPNTVPFISYNQVKQLNQINADVLHIDAVYPLSKHNIPLLLKNIYDDSGHKCTAISATSNTKGLLAITTNNVVLFRLYDLTSLQQMSLKKSISKNNVCQLFLSTQKNLAFTLSNDNNLPKILYNYTFFKENATFIQIIHYGEIDINILLNALEQNNIKTLYYAKNNEFLTLIFSPNKKAVQILYDLIR